MKAKSSFSLKDQLFNREKVRFLAAQFTSAWAAFPSAAFIEDVVSEFPNLELKARIAHISKCLHVALPAHYPDALHLILTALPPALDPTRSDDDFGDFIIAPLSHYVATYGCSAVHLAASLAGLREITMRFSAEDAIRTFINAFPEQTMAFLQECTTHENYHVRRLASEGTRPKLPWAGKLLIDYTVPVTILDSLYADNTRFVTRSVANHLNDISKIDAPLVISILQRWQESGAQAEKEMAFIIRHATRTLVKQGNLAALALMGYGEAPQVKITAFSTSTPTVAIGDAFLFSFTLDCETDQRLLVDYEMVFANPNGKASKKMFKLKQLAVNAGQQVELRKKHPMRLMTTKPLFPGTHTITLQVNGQRFDSLSFELLAA